MNLLITFAWTVWMCGDAEPPSAPGEDGRATGSVRRLDHRTALGGVREDVVVLQPEIPLDAPLSLDKFLYERCPADLARDVKEALPNILEFQAAYIRFMQTGNEPVLRTEVGNGEDAVSSGSSLRGQLRRSNKRPRVHPIVTRRVPLVSTASQVLLPRGTLDVRFHLAQKRFPTAAAVDLRDRIVLSAGGPGLASQFIAVNKPAGIPTEPVASNNKECLHRLVEEALGRRPQGQPSQQSDDGQPGEQSPHQQTSKASGVNTSASAFFLLNRIDLWTAGVVYLARSPAAVAAFNSWQRRGELTKIYKCLATGPTESSAAEHLRGPNRVCRFFNASAFEKTGEVDVLVTHWMARGATLGLAGPRLIRRAPCPGWKAAICRIRRAVRVTESFRPDQVPRSSLGFDRSVIDAVANAKADGFGELFEFEVQLVTGRTHQLRAQFAALGLALVNDTMYTPLRGYAADALDPARVTAEIDLAPLVLDGNSAVLETLRDDAERNLVKLVLETAAPTAPFGLQSHRSVIGPLGIEACAGPPWWQPGGTF